MEDDRNIVVRNERTKMADPFWMWRDFDGIFNSFRRDMDRMLWEPALGFDPSPRRQFVRREFALPMDLEDKGDKLLLTVDMPGVRKEDAKITIEDGVLSLLVDSKEEKNEEEDGKYLFRERSSFSCTRCIRLPEEVDEEHVSARMVDGILNIEIPKKDQKEKIVKEIDIE
ncbi:MAG: Hsp20/alpha crystallin family protein [Candidatus Thermoplasmatota archaeon]|nr:Hsp20/alpha crystallin family protein [Candidatus Thermoplasmatota archaeon]